MNSASLFDAVAARVVAKHGVVGAWTPDGGDPVELLGVFDHDYFSDTGGVGAQTRRAEFKIATAHAPAIATGDALTVKGMNFIITELQPDGAGMTEVILMKVG